MSSENNKQKEVLSQLLNNINTYWEKSGEKLNWNNYDKGVHMIMQANAVEIAKLDEEITDTTARVADNLVKTLIPTKSVLPSPAYTVAHLNPKFPKLKLKPDSVLKISGEDSTGESHEHDFTPLFYHTLQKIQLKYIVTDSTFMHLSEDGRSIVNEKTYENNFAQYTKNVWIGLHMDDEVKEINKTTFFLGKNIISRFDKNHAIFNSGRWFTSIDRVALDTKIGIEHFKSNNQSAIPQQLLDEIGLNDTLERKAKTRFKNSFITIVPPENNPVAVIKSKLPEDNKTLYEYKFKYEDVTPCVWIKIEFDLSLPDIFFKENILHINCIPIFNRQLKRPQSEPIDNLEYIILPMSGDEDNHFLSVHKIWDDSNTYNDEEESATTYIPLDFLTNEDREGSYILRDSVGVRRFNQRDAVQQIERLLGVIQDETETFRQKSVITLNDDFRDIRLTLNKIRSRVERGNTKDGQEKDYFAIVHVRKNAGVIYYSYWTTKGSIFTYVDVTAWKAESLRCTGYAVTKIYDGKNPLDDKQYIDVLRTQILSKGRIVSSGNLKDYCMTHYEELLEGSEINIEREIDRTNKLPSKFEKIILVNINLKRGVVRDKSIIKGLEALIENDLNAASVLYTPIKVKLILPKSET